MDKCVSEPAQAYNGKTALLVNMGLSRVLNLQMSCVQPDDMKRNSIFWRCRNGISISNEHIAGGIRQALRRADHRNLCAKVCCRSTIALKDNGLDCAVRRDDILHNVVAAQTFVHFVAAVYNQAHCRKEYQRTADCRFLPGQFFERFLLCLTARHWKCRAIVEWKSKRLQNGEHGWF